MSKETETWDDFELHIKSWDFYYAFGINNMPETFKKEQYEDMREHININIKAKVYNEEYFQGIEDVDICIEPGNNYLDKKYNFIGIGSIHVKPKYNETSVYIKIPYNSFIILLEMLKMNKFNGITLSVGETEEDKDLVKFIAFQTENYDDD